MIDVLFDDSIASLFVDTCTNADTKVLDVASANRIAHAELLSGFHGKFAEVFEANGEVFSNDSQRIADAFDELASKVGRIRRVAAEEQSRRILMRQWEQERLNSVIQGDPGNAVLPPHPGEPDPPLNLEVEVTVNGGFRRRPEAGITLTPPISMATPSSMYACAEALTDMAEALNLTYSRFRADLGYYQSVCGSANAWGWVDAGMLVTALRTHLNFIEEEAAWVKAVGFAFEQAGSGDGVSLPSAPDAKISTIIATTSSPRYGKIASSALSPVNNIMLLAGGVSEFFTNRNNGKLHDTVPLTMDDIHRLLSELENLDASNFGQGEFGDCYLLASLKGLMGSEWGQEWIRSMIRVEDMKPPLVQVRFFDGNEPVWVSVDYALVSGAHNPDDAAPTLAAVIEAAYQKFRAQHRGRPLSAGFSDEVLADLTGLPTRQLGSPLGYVVGGQVTAEDLSVLKAHVEEGFVAVATTVDSFPGEFFFDVKAAEFGFNAKVHAEIPGLGEKDVLVPGGHAYTILAVDGDRIKLLNPWEYNKDLNRDRMESHEGLHKGEFWISIEDFIRLFGDVGLVGGQT